MAMTGKERKTGADAPPEQTPAHEAARQGPGVTGGKEAHPVRTNVPKPDDDEQDPVRGGPDEPIIEDEP
jgi:hypothetical protein